MMVAFRGGAAIDNAKWPSFDRERMKSYPRILLLGVALLASASTLALGQSGYPDHPVRVIVPFAPGGVVDVMARLLSQKLSGDLRENFYLQNLGGAGGDIGTRNAASSTNDGYSILMTSSSFVINPSLHAQTPYDPIKDFEPISIAASSPNVVVVSPNVAAKNMQELAEAIRRDPDKYSFGSAGIGTTPHLSGELFRLSAGIKLVHVPFAGAGPALQATVGGFTPITFSSLPAAIPLIKGGLVRALAVTSPNRVSALPDVPTMAEAGFPGQEAATLLFVLAPAGTPPGVVNKLSVEFRSIVASPDVKSQFDTLGFSPLAMSPEESAKRVSEEIARWGKVIKDANIHEGGD
jgi:tripartite-type tricarboxylate transporter receptor subunit TctC